MPGWLVRKDAIAYHGTTLPNQATRLSFLSSQNELATHALIQATGQVDLPAMVAALAQGADPNATMPCQGVAGESLCLWLVRRAQARGLEVLLQGGAQPDSAVVLAAGLLVERATNKADAEQLEHAREVVRVLECHGVDWGTSDRFVAGGARAIDLLAHAQPEWAQGPAARLGLEPRALAGNGATQASAGRTGRVRRC